MRDIANVQISLSWLQRCKSKLVDGVNFQTQPPVDGANYQTQPLVDGVNFQTQPPALCVN